MTAGAISSIRCIDRLNPQGIPDGVVPRRRIYWLDADKIARQKVGCGLSKGVTVMTDQCDLKRRHMLQSLMAGSAGCLAWGLPKVARAANAITLPFENGLRELTTAFPQKGEMLLVRR